METDVYAANYEAGLRIIDISDPASPVEVGFFDTQGLAKGVDLVGNYAYVADDGQGLCIIDVSDPANPVQVGFYESPGQANGVHVVGDFAYLADGYARRAYGLHR